MKKYAGIMVLVVALIGIAFGAGTYDFEDYGTSISVTNKGNDEIVVRQVYLKYDAATTNTLNVYKTLASVDWLVETEAVSNAATDVFVPTATLYWKPGQILKFETTVTNLQIYIDTDE